MKSSHNARTLYVDGVPYTTFELGKKMGATADVIRSRLKRGWTIDRIASQPVARQRNTWDEPIERDVTARAAISVAVEKGGLSLTTIGEIMGVSRQRVAGIERVALKKLAFAAPELSEYLAAIGNYADDMEDWDI